MDYFDADDGVKLDQVKHNRSTISTNMGGSVNGFIDGSVQFFEKVGQAFVPVVLSGTTPYWRTNTATRPDQSCSIALFPDGLGFKIGVAGDVARGKEQAVNHARRQWIRMDAFQRRLHPLY